MVIKHQAHKLLSEKRFLCLKSILGSKYDPNSELQIDILRSAIFNSVESKIKAILYFYKNGSIENLVRHADEIYYAASQLQFVNNDVM